MEFFFIALFFLGVAFGSFINVLSIRYKTGEKLFSKRIIGGRSHCTNCKKILAWYELIPVASFLFQRGRCRKCKEKLTLQYPIIEIVSGIIFVGVPLFLNNFWGVSQNIFITFNSPLWYYALVFSWVFIFITLLLISIIDLKHYIIPDELNILLIIFGVVIFTVFYFHIKDLPLFSNSFVKQYSLFLSFTQNIFVNHLLGSIIAGLFLFSLNILTKGKGMGFGDVKLAFSLGIILGWPDIFLVILLAFILGGLWGMYLIFSKSKTMKDKIPFAPFLVLGGVIDFFLGFYILNGYFIFLGL